MYQTKVTEEKTFPVLPSKSFPKSSILKPPKTTRTSILGAKYNPYVSKHKTNLERKVHSLTCDVVHKSSGTISQVSGHVCRSGHVGSHWENPPGGGQWGLRAGLTWSVCLNSAAWCFSCLSLDSHPLCHLPCTNDPERWGNYHLQEGQPRFMGSTSQAWGRAL